MSVIHQPRPNFSTAQAVNLAKLFYGKTASARELSSERDQNFLLEDEIGGKFVLKISNENEEYEMLDLQNKAIKHIAAFDKSLQIPRICNTSSGLEIAEVENEKGERHYLRLLTYLSGTVMAKVKPHVPTLLHSLGRFLGSMDKALMDFSHPAAYRELKWDTKNTTWIKGYTHYIKDRGQRGIVENYLSAFETQVIPFFPHLRTSIIHNDGNDYNIVVDTTSLLDKPIVGIVDFGDMVNTFTICELSNAIAYALFEKEDPLQAASRVIRGYNEIIPLTDLEIRLLFHFICARLCVSVTNSAFEKEADPHNEYLTISEQPAWFTLERLCETNPQLAYYIFRDACNIPPCPESHYVIEWLKDNQQEIGPVVELDLSTAKKVVFDLSVESPELGLLINQFEDQAITNLIVDRMRKENADLGVGRYGEARWLDRSDKAIHLGIDLFMEASSPVFSSLDGFIHSISKNGNHSENNSTIIIKHLFEDGKAMFYTLYMNLSEKSLEGFETGMPVRKGDQIGSIGETSGNNNLPPHLHFQVIVDLLGGQDYFPKAAPHDQREVWLSICPDPNLVLGIPEDCFPPAKKTQEDILRLRQQHMGRSLSLAYKEHLKIVRGRLQYLYDDNGTAYLDCVNNVAHVGHCHPKVVYAGQKQMALLNTNTRYLHDKIVELSQRICATMPAPLRVCFFVCSGSEANELALRLARTHTKQRDILVIDGAYHGNTSSLIDISPYKYDGPGGSGAPAHVHKVVMPDVYHGVYKSSDLEAGKKYAEDVQKKIQALKHIDRTPAAFICESLLGCGGQIVLPDNYLKQAFRYVREAGGVCIVDEVQVGFGRVGTHFWGFQTQGVIPDIITLGKPMGNGHPVAAVITTAEIAASFNNGMEYFNTFGGNPVSCAIALAVLDVIEDEHLQENARQVGEYLKASLVQLMQKHPLIGDVRGLGLFIGVELVLDRENLAPAPTQATYIIERMKDHGILLSTDGPRHNVIKIKPPMVFSVENVDFLVNTLDKILEEDYANLF